MRLAVFDLDHTLLDGDSDVLWCNFLMDQGLLERASFEPRNQAMERDYRAGTVSTQDYCNFYVGTLAGRTPAEWQPWRERFWHERVRPRIHVGTANLLQHHRGRGDTLVMSTATNRFITELTAAGLGFEHLIATECEREPGDTGRFTGRTQGAPNMRAGKIDRLQAWLVERGLSLETADCSFYSDSMNDLPLLERVREPVVTHGEARLLAVAAERGWRTISLRASNPTETC
jgi:HAD superfamily hydrolase (TIGR01490 family)